MSIHSNIGDCEVSSKGTLQFQARKAKCAGLHRSKVTQSQLEKAEINPYHLGRKSIL
jgi:hypothetical protein